MFNSREFYKKENEKIYSTYADSITRIKQIIEEMSKIEDDLKENYFSFMTHTAKLIIKLCKLEANLTDEYFRNTPLEELQSTNNSLYAEILPRNYENSYANPQYCVKIFGNEYGQLISWFYTLYRAYITYAFYHKQYKMEEYNHHFIEVYDYIKNNSIDYETLKEKLTGIMKKDRSRDIYYQYKEQYDVEFKYYTSIIMNEDLSDPKYLFRFGTYIAENEIQASKFIAQYPSDKLELLAEQIVKAYYNGFSRDNKAQFLQQKSSIGFLPTIGLEKLYRKMISFFNQSENRLKTSFLGYRSTRANEQYDYDHKFDMALVLDDKYKDRRIKDYQEGISKNEDILKEYSGIMYIEKFGDPQFSPETKEENLKLTPDQQKIYQRFNGEIIQIINKYMPRSETSFCIVGFPTPKIGNDYEAIFEETIKINMLDSAKYEGIQSKIIDVLDQASYVHVKGKGDNKTDLKLAMQPIKDSANQTNFMNSGASVNIPCGEVFTAPQLEGTTGILHVFETYQSGLRYDNLILHFTDGYTTEYSCTNFDSEDENKKYIKDNLLFPHEKLPIGEFAIGTNTIAYMMARKYDIMKLLPILILEKTGPHFAIGDTCFSREEDREVFNPISKKSVCSKDNEKSILRTTDPMEAYTNKHEDIVLPFDDIEFITAISEDERKIDVIRNGRFVIPGTEELNDPMDK